MRSMLALGASNLALLTPSSAELRDTAMSHRVKAVGLLNQALCRPALTREEGDARFAAFMVLTFQSTCMEDGLIDFLTMLRGCILSGDLGELSAFACFLKDNHIDTMTALFNTAESLELEIDALDEGTISLVALEPLCQTEVEKRYHKHLTALIKNAYTSPKAGQYFSHSLVLSFTQA